MVSYSVRYYLLAGLRFQNASSWLHRTSPPLARVLGERGGLGQKVGRSEPHSGACLGFPPLAPLATARGVVAMFRSAIECTSSAAHDAGRCDREQWCRRGVAAPVGGGRDRPAHRNRCASHHGNQPERSAMPCSESQTLLQRLTWCLFVCMRALLRGATPLPAGSSLEIELPASPADSDEVIQAATKRTYQPNRLKRKRTHGFLKCAMPFSCCDRHHAPSTMAPQSLTPCAVRLPRCRGCASG